MSNTTIAVTLLLAAANAPAAERTVAQGGRLALRFSSSRTYDNALYDVKGFTATFTSPTGRTRTVPGFWDGDRVWRVRFRPDEQGVWSWVTACSDRNNEGLQGRRGGFTCVATTRTDPLAVHGALTCPPGRYHLTYRDGTPFFWLGDTAWNGALLAGDEDWDRYLARRREQGYNVIQFVTTPWRGAAADRAGQTAYTGTGYLTVNPRFFQRLDRQVDRINDHGLVAAPVLLWALPFAAGRHLNPGYVLPVDEAVLLARYIVARYQGHQVVWILGGDGRYVEEFADRWKAIGRRVFADIDHAPVTLHPHGRLFVGDVYADEPWYGIMGYQSSHSFARGTVDWINRGPMAGQWDRLRPMPTINLEPLYENIRENQTAEHVRNAVWWSLHATPVAGVTYGANGIWPWLERDGDPILNHGQAPWTVSWRHSLDLPVSREMPHVRAFFEAVAWWTLFPAPDLLRDQPGLEAYDRFVGILANADRSLVTAYVPAEAALGLRNLARRTYTVQWYDPVTGSTQAAGRTGTEPVIELSHGADHGLALRLTAE